jgi:creatinine deaminase
MPTIEEFLAPARAEARDGLAEGGVPVGSALWIDDELRASGRNQRVQQGNPILHGETHCLQQAGRLPAADYRRATLVTTLSPCDMCTGAILLFGIPRVIIGENRTFMGGEDLLRARGVEVIVVDDAECAALMGTFVADYPEVWNEDIGV